MREEETVQGACCALQTGYGMLGPFDYARIPASSVPELSLAGDKPFTLFTTVCFKNVQGGAIFAQENGFCFGIMDGQLYVAAVDWCAVKFSEYTVGKFITGHWYELAIVYDGTLLTKAFARIMMLRPVQQFRFNIRQKVHNQKQTIIELADKSTPINFTGCISSKPNSDSHTQLTGMVSLATPIPVMCELEGEIVTLWESRDIPQTGL